MRAFRCLVFLFLGCVVLTATRAFAEQEGILSFDSKIEIHSDSTMTVHETITVYCADDQIKHGIYRDFPTNYEDVHGKPYKVGFNVTQVKKNGAPEPYEPQALPDGVRVRIGYENVFLNPGTYRYDITYDTDRQIGFFKDHDELYWNVTGNGWEFPIEKASASVALPSKVPSKSLGLAAYTGLLGARGTYFKARLDKSGTPTFSTTRPLGLHAGLTIVVGWPKGIVAEPTHRQRINWFIRDNQSAVIGLVGFAAVLLYYLIAWSAVGKDPPKKTIAVTWDPPEGLSPAALRYIARMQCDNKAVTAAITSAAVKGVITIEDDEQGVYVLKRKSGDDSVLSADERLLIAALLDKDGVRKMSDLYTLQITHAVDLFSRRLQDNCGERFYRTNRRYVIAGIAASVVSLLAAILSFLNRSDTAVMLGPSALFSALAVVSFLVLFPIVSTSESTSPAVKVVGVTCWTLLIGGMGVAALKWCGLPGLGLLIATTFLGVLNMAFYRLLKCYTCEGMALLGKIRGFRLYMSVAEKDELDQAGAPDRNPALYEKFLPYAIALDVERRWAAKFSSVLAQASMGQGVYQPSWYSGALWTSVGIAGFGSSLSRSLGSAVSASSTASGSGSGSGGGLSGGGGSSGGGGGGGGGW